MTVTQGIYEDMFGFNRVVEKEPLADGIAEIIVTENPNDMYQFLWEGPTDGIVSVSMAIEKYFLDLLLPWDMRKVGSDDILAVSFYRRAE